MNRAPYHWKAYELFSYGSTIDTPLEQRADGKWQPARPLEYDTLRTRIQLAWRVFRGKLDVVEWDWYSNEAGHSDE